MSVTAAGRFSELSRELRDMIWAEAAAAQFLQLLTVPHIADRLRSSSSSQNPAVERRRQAFIDYEGVPPGQRRFLRLHVRDSADKNKIRVVEDEFQALVSSLPIGTVSHEARSHAIDFCLTKVKAMDLFYASKDCDPSPGLGMQVQSPIRVFVQPTTVMVTKSRGVYPEFAQFGAESSRPIDYKFPKLGVDFESPQHLVDVISCVFNDSVERLILNFWVDVNDNLESIYWPHTVQTLKGRKKATKPAYIQDEDHDPNTVFMTPDRKMHAVERIWVEDEFKITDAALHILKLFEIFDAVKAEQRLSRLQRIDLELHTLCWGEDLLSTVRTKIKNDIIWISWNDVAVEFQHPYVAPKYS